MGETRNIPGMLNSAKHQHTRLELANCRDFRGKRVSPRDLFIEPISLTFLAADLDLYQQSFFFTLCAALQERIKAVLFDSQNMIFPEKKGDIILMRLPKTSLRLPVNRYRLCFASLLVLKDLPLAYYVWNNPRYEFSHEKLVLIRDIVFGRRSREFSVSLDRRSLERIFSVNQYSCSLRQTLMACNTARCQRIYQFISTYKLYGLRRITYEDFLMKLGFSQCNVRRGKRTDYEAPLYVKFSDFYRFVLNPARKEIRRLADQGYADCYFKLSVDYPKGKTSGNPLWLNFHILKANGVPSIISNLPPSPYQSTLDSMIEDLQISRPRAKVILSSVSESEITELDTKISRLKGMLEEGHRVDRVGPWAATSIINFLDEMRSRRGAGLIDVVLKQERPSLSDRTARRWMELCTFWQMQMKRDIYEGYFKRLRIHSYGKGRDGEDELCLYVPDMTTRDYINSQLGALAPSFRQFFPGLKGLHYYVEPQAYLFYSI